MKLKFLLFIISVCLLCSNTKAQVNWQQVLDGTWKIENKNQYEHWDVMNTNSLKGYSYVLKNNIPQVIEYLSLDKKGSKWIYSATVKGQNGGKSISFSVQESDSVLRIVNPKHDFPKTIIYRYKDSTNLSVTISDNNEKKFSYNLTKINITNPINNTTDNPNYDASLAKELNADNYGMKAFYLVILKTGSNISTNTTERNESFRQHLANINRLVEDKKMIVAGPLGKNDNSYRGIFILHNIESKEELRNILSSDLAIKKNYLTFEIYDWYGSAALPTYLENSDKIWKSKP